MMVVESEIVMVHKGEEASFSLIECNEDGEEISRSGRISPFQLDIYISFSAFYSSYS